MALFELNNTLVYFPQLDFIVLLEGENCAFSLQFSTETLMLTSC